MITPMDPDLTRAGGQVIEDSPLSVTRSPGFIDYSKQKCGDDSNLSFNQDLIFEIAESLYDDSDCPVLDVMRRFPDVDLVVHDEVTGFHLSPRDMTREM
jgi:hypothetical protein